MSQKERGYVRAVIRYEAGELTQAEAAEGAYRLSDVFPAEPPEDDRPFEAGVAGPPTGRTSILTSKDIVAGC